MDITGMYDHAIRTHWPMAVLWSLITIAVLTAGACVVYLFNHRPRHPRCETQSAEPRPQSTDLQQPNATPERPQAKPKPAVNLNARYMPRASRWASAK